MSEPAKSEAVKPGAKKGIGKWLIAGALTMTAAGVFVAVAPSFNSGNNQPTAAQTEPAPEANPGANRNETQQAALIIPATTRDGKLLRVTLEIPALQRGPASPTDDVYKASLQGFVAVSVMSAFLQYNAAEIPQNIGRIESELSAFIAKQFVIGVDGTNPVLAQEGVNFGRPSLTRLEDASTGTALWQKSGAKAPAAQKIGL